MEIDYNLISDDPKIYSFKGDLKQFLLNVGVTSEHIEKMKQKKLKDVHLLNCLHDIDSSSYRTETVSVEKIIGIRRACPDKSVYDNVDRFDGEQYFDVRKLIDCLSYANKMSYDELIKSYEDLPDPVDLIHIVNTDEYYLSLEHNHTTICAMIFNAPYIKAKVCDSYINEKKTENYYQMHNFYKEHNIAWIEKGSYGKIIIVFKKDDTLYSFDYGYIDIGKHFEDLISEIEEKLESYDKAASIYNKLPLSFLKNIYYNLFLTEKQRKYIKMPLYTEKDNFNEFLIYLNINL